MPHDRLVDQWARRSYWHRPAETPRPKRVHQFRIRAISRRSRVFEVFPDLVRADIPCEGLGIGDFAAELGEVNRAAVTVAAHDHIGRDRAVATQRGDHMACLANRQAVDLNS